MTPDETRCVMTQIVMPLHTNRRHTAVLARRHERLRAAGRTEHPS
jgi:hypothetical protein